MLRSMKALWFRASPEAGKRLARLPLLALGMLSLLTGVWGGLLRVPLGLPLPTEHANWISYHGPLMVCGFLGTVIGLERAVGLPGRWPYAAPLLTGAGAVLIASGGLGWKAPGLITLGSAVFVAVTLRVVLLQRAVFTAVMSAGAMAWLAGNALWLAGWPFNRVVPWWMAFLALTIVGERLDLGRFQRPVRGAQPLLAVALGLFLAGVVSSAFWQKPGEQLAGLGMLGLALWLGRFDLARRTVKQPGLPRFMAVCLLAGYGWMAIAGLGVFWLAPLESGARYDLPLHAFFLGFVFSMIFGHAPVIFPAVLLVPTAFHVRFYGHVVLLHVALCLRVVGDLSGWPPGRPWGAALNATALALFLINTVSAMALRRQKA